MRALTKPAAFAILYSTLWTSCAPPAALPQPGPPAHASAETPERPAACEYGSTQAAIPESSSHAILEAHGTGLDAYRVTGGAWLSDQPLLFNEPFDFAVAMSLQNIGPAIAAGKRLQNNEAKRDATRLTLRPALQQRVAKLRACGVHAYAVLWGSEEACGLQVVLDVFQRADGKLRQVEHRARESEETRPLTGPDAWSTESLSADFEQALDALLTATPQVAETRH